MDIFSNLQNLLGAIEGGDPGVRRAAPAGGMNASGGMLSPGMLGGLATALLGGKAGGAGSGALGGLLESLLGGGGGGGGGLGGGGLLNSALGGLLGGGGGGPLSGAAAGVIGGQAAASSSASDRETRVLRALVYAAKADGRISAEEQAGIDNQIAKLGLNEGARARLNKIMSEPLDPNRIASGVTDANEAVGLYALSCAITNMDHFMERGYLDGLATALRIPADAKAKIEAKVLGR